MTWLLLAGTALAWNPTGTTWDGDELPFSINSTGSASLPDFATVEGVLLDSYETWTEQACTSFTVDYQGTSNRSSGSNGDGRTVHGFLQSWPGGYGDPVSTIGITVTLFGFRGGTEEADVSFNEETYTFIDGAPASWGFEADLQSIATHEFGHSLGLDHTNTRGATMFPSYDGGTGTRTLANDDINGVCALYPGTGAPPTGGDDDDYEQNDDWPEAAVVSCGDLIEGVAADDDWFVLETTGRAPIEATLTWTDSTNDLDLYLFDEAEQIDASDLPRGTAEQVDGGEQPAGIYYLAVVPFAGEDTYELGITCDGVEAAAEPIDEVPEDDAYEEDDSVQSATGISCGERTSAIALDEDWFLVESPGSGAIEVTVAWANEGAADLDLFLSTTAGPVATAERREGVREKVRVEDASSAESYALVIVPVRGQTAYDLAVECEAAVPVEPVEEEGCACSSGGPGLGWLALLPVALLRRRRS